MNKQVLALATIGAAVLSAFGAAATPASAARVAACKQWSVSGSWSTSQTNAYHVAFRFAQTGTSFPGTATLPPQEASAGGFVSRTGKVTGTMRGSHLVLKTVWQKTTGRAVGQYMGTVSKGKGKGDGLGTRHHESGCPGPRGRLDWHGPDAMRPRRLIRSYSLAVLLLPRPTKSVRGAA
jgi:hypothetical protein